MTGEICRNDSHERVAEARNWSNVLSTLRRHGYSPLCVYRCALALMAALNLRDCTSGLVVFTHMRKTHARARRDEIRTCIGHSPEPQRNFVHDACVCVER